MRPITNQNNQNTINNLLESFSEDEDPLSRSFITRFLKHCIEEEILYTEGDNTYLIMYHDEFPEKGKLFQSWASLCIMHPIRFMKTFKRFKDQFDYDELFNTEIPYTYIMKIVLNTDNENDLSSVMNFIQNTADSRNNHIVLSAHSIDEVSDYQPFGYTIRHQYFNDNGEHHFIMYK
ncbi:MAG: hypothetical protein RR565_01800 [Erysipelothrix sp.]